MAKMQAEHTHHYTIGSTIITAIFKDIWKVIKNLELFSYFYKKLNRSGKNFLVSFNTCILTNILSYIWLKSKKPSSYVLLVSLFSSFKKCFQQFLTIFFIYFQIFISKRSRKIPARLTTIGSINLIDTAPGKLRIFFCGCEF